MEIVVARHTYSLVLSEWLRDHHKLNKRAECLHK